MTVSMVDIREMPVMMVQDVMRVGVHNGIVGTQLKEMRVLVVSLG